ncbi:serine/threonine-protein kinase [Rhodopirellula sallentina]|uniref:Serine/threonine protein kinase-related domain protein n=1 Tax=Rhodopirellula sallentina SM41 TaxID=1263870 RepID=M5UIL4_9BACT|nr:serine/threonine-protein kinase [Rhodopirellula sallentina]EMI55868.1 Serine/threonine protein kinase-related domain protein [Rhodopirellula sallentina SM41]
MILRRGYEFTTGYRLQEYLGKGQFGEVWRASGPGGVLLAVKFIDLEGGRGQKEYEAIKRIKSIRHANLMPITAIWKLDVEGQLIPEPHNDDEQTIDAIDMESRGQSGFVVTAGSEPATLVVGMSLGDASLERYLPEKDDPNPQSRIPASELLKFMEGIARGMDYLNSPVHDFGKGPVSLQHCDVKPANIVLIGDSAVLCDFGLARILSRNQVTATDPSGTPAYMSPEAIEGKPSRTSDQYSLAVTYYHLRTGTLPVDSNSVHGVLQAHMSGRLDFGRCGEAERAVLRRATNRDWRQRFESNSHFISTIRDVMVKSGELSAGQQRHPFVEPREHRKASGPSGPAARGIETYDQEDLTDGVVKHSKGGSPILTGAHADDASHDTYVAQFPANQTADLQPNFDADEVRAVMNPGETGASHALASDGPRDAFQFGHAVSDEPATASPHNWRKIAGSGGAILAVVLAAMWWMRPTDDAPPVPVPILEIGDDLEQTKKMFATFVDQHPSFLIVEPKTIDAHRDAVESMLPIKVGGPFVTTGYDSKPKRWGVVPSKANENASKPNAKDASDATVADLFPSADIVDAAIDDLGETVLYANAVRMSANGEWLYVGAGESLFAWRTQTLITNQVDEFPVPPSRRWDFDANVVAVAVHPKNPTLAVVSLEEPVLEVVDASSESATDSVARSEVNDIVKDLCFVASGAAIVVQFEYGEMAALRWDNLIGNDGTTAAVPTTPFDVRDCRVMFPKPDPASKQIWIGHANGMLTKHRIEMGEQLELESVVLIDTIAQKGISAIDAVYDTEGNDTVILSGSIDESIALTTPNGENVDAPMLSTVVPLSSGPVRSVALSADGDWFVAGADGAVWVGHVEHPHDYLTRLEVGNVSAESLLIDEQNDVLIVGRGDGKISVFHWTHVRLRSLLPTNRPDDQMKERDKLPSPPASRLTFQGNGVFHSIPTRTSFSLGR